MQGERVSGDLRAALSENAQIKIQEGALKEHIQQVRTEVRDKEKAIRDNAEAQAHKSNMLE